MPVQGTLDHERQLARLPRVEDLAAERRESKSVEILRFAGEIAPEAGAAAIPAALSAVSPPYACIEMRRHLDSEWGPFSIAMLFIAARADMRAVGYAAGGFCDSERVVEYLRLQYGARLRRAAISLERRYVGIEGRIATEGRLIFDAVLEKPEPMGAANIAPMPLLHLAKFEGQLWLIEEDRETTLETAERGTSLIRTFEADAFGEPGIALRQPLPALYLRSSLALLPVHTLIDPAQPGPAGLRTIE